MRKRRFVGLLGLFAAMGVCLGVSLTIAGYVVVNSFTRTVASGGILKKSIFLNANIWETDNPVYYLNLHNSSSNTYLLKEASKVIYPTIGNDDFKLTVFEYDTSAGYDQFQFFRVNPRYQYETTALDTTASTFKVLGSFDTWTYADATTVMYQDFSDPNHYVANGVELQSGATLKICDNSAHYYSNKTNGNHYTVSNDNDKNVVISETGTYTIDFYVSASNDNHITLLKEGYLQDYQWNWTSLVSYSDSINYYCITGWGSNGLSTHSTNHLSVSNGSLVFA